MKQELKSAQPETRSVEKIGSLLKTLHKLFNELFFEKARQHGLTIPQLWVVWALKKQPYQNLLTLSQATSLSKSTVSGIVSRLVAQGIVVREIPESNRRMVQLSLSPDYTQIDALQKLRAKFFNKLAANASPEELESVVNGLETLLRLMQEMREANRKKQ